MRSFMRAIGGLFKSSSRHSGKNQQHAASRRHGGPAMCTLVPVDDIHLMMPDARASSTFADSHRKSSVYERPQFLFFCGSDNSGVPAARRTGYNNTVPSRDFSTSTGELQARASYRNSPTSATTIPAPMISHRIPVFFAPQPAMTGSFE